MEVKLNILYLEIAKIGYFSQNTLQKRSFSLTQSHSFGNIKKHAQIIFHYFIDHINHDTIYFLIDQIYEL